MQKESRYSCIDKCIPITIYFGDVRYLLHAGWFKKWKPYVGYDTWDQSNKVYSHPGPIDNSPLLKGSGKFYHSHWFSYADDNIPTCII